MQAQIALAAPSETLVDTNIGKLLLEAGKITEKDIDRIIQEQRENRLRFGEAALRLGLIKEEDILRALSRQFEFPCLVSNDSSFSPSLIAAHHPYSKPVETLRALRSQLMLHWFGGHRKYLSLVGMNEEDGAKIVVANLAIVFSQLGENTLLIDADLRNHVLHQLFGIAPGRGLADVLISRSSLEDVTIRLETFTSLSILRGGTTAPNPQELLNRPQFRELLEAAAQQYDAILLNTSPIKESADAQTVTARSGGCVIVARRHVTRLTDLGIIKEQLLATGVEVLGVVLNH